MTATTGATVVRNWVELYTRRLAPELRNARRAEIESDLWAHADEAAAIGRGSVALDVEMLTRLALGIPADILWRRSHRAAAGSIDEKEIVMHEPRSHQVLTAIGVVWAGLGLAFASVGLIVIQQNKNSDPAPDVWVASGGAVAVIVGVALALIGLLRVSRSPTAGRRMAIVGAVVIGGAFLASFSWAWFVGLAILAPNP